MKTEASIMRKKYREAILIERLGDRERESELGFAVDPA